MSASNNKPYSPLSYKELNETLNRLGVHNHTDWIAVILFIRNLLPRFSVIDQEQKSRLQREVLAMVEKRDFSHENLERVVRSLQEGFTDRLQDSLGLMEQKLANEQQLNTTLLSEIQVLVEEFRKSVHRQSTDLEEFGEQTVSDIEQQKDPSEIISYIRDTIQEIVSHSQKEAQNWEERAKSLEFYAKYDHLLTSLYNRSWLDEHLPGLVEQHMESGSSLSLLMIDVDHFKKINDNLGHLVGDDVLKALSKLTKAHSDVGGGFACRYGGEELCIIFRDTDEELAKVRAEELRKEVCNYNFVPRKSTGELGDPLQFTISIGVAQLQQGYDSSQLISAADKALYRAKDSGRNRVVTYSQI